MFHSSLDEMVSAGGKSKAGAGGANSIANNFEFQRLQRDVSQELSSIKIGRNGKTGADRHPKMQKALELVDNLGCAIDQPMLMSLPDACTFLSSGRGRKYFGSEE